MKTFFLKKPWLLLGAALYLTLACSEEYDFNKFSGVIAYDPEVDAPIVWGSLTAGDMLAKWDSLMENRGDTVVLVFRDDSLFYFNVEDFSGVPEQDTSEFNLISVVPYPVMPFDSLVIDSTDVYTLTLEDNMRIDSMFINDGYLMIEVNSSFRHAGTLTIEYPGVFVDEQVFHKTIQISSAAGDFHDIKYYPLINTRIYVDNSVPGEGSIISNYLLVLQNSGQSVDIGDRVQINYSFIDLDEFDAIFGFAGNGIYDMDTALSTGLEEISGISGSFSVTDPQINVTYKNSFGLPVGIDLSILGLYGDGHTVLINPDEQLMEASDDYLQPWTEGLLEFNQANIPNIGDFLSFPPPDSLVAGGEARANPGASDARNFVLKNSSIQVGIEIEVPLAFKADLQLRDTFRLDIEKPEATNFVEYANLHYRIRNEFPIKLDPYIILYDSIADVNLDTVFFTGSLTESFIPAAPVDENGVTITSQVEDFTGVIRLDESLIDNFFGDTNKMIMVGSVASTNTENVVILTTYKFDFKVNLEAKIRYQTDFNNTSGND